MSAALKYVGLGRRSLAWLLDLMLLTALWLPFLYLVNTFAAALDSNSVGWLVFALLRNLVVFSISVYVLAWTTARYGGTPGKQLLEIQVIDAGRDGQRLTLQRALIRVLLSLASIFTLVGVLMLLFDEQRQAFHDWFLHTRVIEQTDYADEPVSGSRA